MWFNTAMRLLLPILVILLAGVGWLLLGLGSSEVQNPIAAAETAETPEPDAPIVVQPPTGRKDAPTSARKIDEIDRPLVSPTVTLVVIDTTTSRPVPGAVVRHLPLGVPRQTLPTADPVRFQADKEELLREVGTEQSSDRAGSITVPEGWVVARSGLLYGELDARLGASELRLFPDKPLTVTVVDALNQPVAGIGVSCGAPTIPGTGTRIPTAWRLGNTDSNGRLHLPHFGHHIWQQPYAEFTLFAELAGGTAGKLTLERNSLPNDPVRITLPPTGSLTAILLDAVGRPLDPELLPNRMVTLGAVDEISPALPAVWRGSARVQADSRARIDRVVLGQTLRITPPWDYATPVDIQGPTRDRPHAVMELKPDQDQPSLRGRMVDEAGSPLAGAEFRVDGLGARVRGHTNETGQFMVFLPRQSPGQPTDLAFRIEGSDGATATRTAQAHGVTVVAPITDLGDVSAPISPLLVSGTIVHPTGEKVGLPLELHTLSPSGWQQLPHITPRSVVGGRFEFRGVIPGEALRLAIRPGDYAPAEPIEFTRQTEGLRIVLRPQAKMEVVVLVDDDVEANTLQLDLVRSELTRTVERASDPLARTLGAIRRPVIFESGPGRFAASWRGLGPGIHNLTVGHRGMRSPPIEIDGIVLSAGKATDDPRLKTIDLRRR